MSFLGLKTSPNSALIKYRDYEMFSTRRTRNDGDSKSDSASTSSQGHAPDAEIKAFGEEPIFIADQRRIHGTGTFDADSLSSVYKPVDTYEGAHRYDPGFEWDTAEEKRLIDIRICAFVCLCFFALQLDRGNIVQALADNMLDDLGLNTNDYNTGQTIFYVSFLAAELPSQLISKWIGPDNWIPIQMVSWSLIAAMQAFLSGKTSFYVTRSLLGVMEGGFIPDNVLYLSYWYTSKELPRRLSFFWSAYQFTFIVGAFLAFGFLHMRGVNGLAGWRWLFALEGTFTGIIGIFCWFYLPPGVCQTKGSIRGKNGWFTEHEEKILVNRVLRDDPSKGDMHNRQYIKPREFLTTLLDYDMWPMYLLGLTWMIPAAQLSAYLTLQLRALHFDPFESSLLTIPAYTIFILNLLFWTWISEKYNQRILLILVTQFWILPNLVALEVLPDNASRWARYACSTLIVGYPYLHAVCVAITSRNAGSVRTRTVASAMYNMCVQASSIIAINIYRQKDMPFYRTGNKVLLGILAYNVFAVIGAKFYYVYRNKQKAAIWDAMTREEKDAYLVANGDKGNRRLDFRFAH